MEARPYQAEAFVRALTQPWDWAYSFWCTGAGKTSFANWVLAYMLQHGIIHHGFIMSPFRATRGGFVPSSEFHRTIEFPRVTHDGRRLLPPDLDELLETLLPNRCLVIPEGMFRQATTDTRRTLRDYLADPDPGYILSVCHATATSAVHPEDWPEDMTGMCAVFDECQMEREGTALGAVSSVIRSRGGDDESEVDLRGTERSLCSRRLRGMGLSATPCEDEPLQDRGENIFVTYRSLVEQMADGYAPNVRFSIVPVAVQGDTVEEKIDQLVRAGVCLQRPGMKTVTRIKPRQGRVGGLTLPNLIRNSLLEQTAQAGIPTFDCTYYDGGAQTDVFLARERQVSFAESGADILIGVQAVGLALDWIHANCLISFGLPQSPTTLIQVVGRTTRCKVGIQGYPEEFLHESHAYFLVPVDSGCTDMEAFTETQQGNLARMMIGVSLVLSQLTLPQAFRAHMNVRDHLYEVLGAVRDHVGPRMVRTPQRARALFELFRLRELNMTVGELRNYLVSRGFSQEDANEVVVQLAAAQEAPGAEARRRAALSQNQQRVREAISPYDEAFAICVEVVANDFIDLRANPLLQGSFEVTSLLDARSARAITSYFVETLGDLSADQVLRWAIDAYEQHDCFPTTGPVFEGAETTWEEVIQALRSGTCNLPRHPSIEAFVADRVINPIQFLVFMERMNRFNVRTPADVDRDYRWEGRPLSYRVQRRLFVQYRRAFESMTLDRQRRHHVLCQLTAGLGLISVLGCFRANDRGRWRHCRLNGWPLIARWLDEGRRVTLQHIRDLVQGRSLGGPPPISAPEEAA